MLEHIVTLYRLGSQITKLGVSIQYTIIPEPSSYACDVLVARHSMGRSPFQAGEIQNSVLEDLKSITTPTKPIPQLYRYAS